MQPYLKIRSMSDDPIDLYANLNLNEIKAEFILDIKSLGGFLEIGGTPELEELEKEYAVLEKYCAWKEIIENCDKVLEIDENNFTALFRKGNAFVYLEEWDDAIEIFEKSYSVTTNNIETELASMGFGVILVTRADNVMSSQKVKDYGIKAKELGIGNYHPENEREIKEMVETAMCDAEKAILALRHVCEINPENAVAMIFLGFALSFSSMMYKKEEESLNAEALSLVNKGRSIIESKFYESESQEDKDKIKMAILEASTIKLKILITMKKIDEAKMEAESMKKLREEIKNDK